MSAGRVGYFDIRLTHRNGKRVRGVVTWTNERNSRTAIAVLNRCQRENPTHRFVLIERTSAGEKPFER